MIVKHRCICKNDTVLTAYAESARGPGWANAPVWLIVRSAAGALRQECLQPEEQTETMRLFYRVSEQAHHTMTAEATRRERPR